jgi:glucan biosynthesis protein
MILDGIREVAAKASAEEFYEFSAYFFEKSKINNASTVCIKQL